MNADAREWLDARAREAFGQSLEEVRQRALTLTRNFFRGRAGFGATRTVQMSDRDFAVLAFMATIGSDAFVGTETRDAGEALVGVRRRLSPPDGGG